MAEPIKHGGGGMNSVWQYFSNLNCHNLNFRIMNIEYCVKNLLFYFIAKSTLGEDKDEEKYTESPWDSEVGF